MRQVKSVAITMRALIQRINRKLAHEDRTLKAARSEGMRQQVGNFFLLSISGNSIEGHDIDPVKMGRKLGVLQPWERVDEEV